MLTSFPGAAGPPYRCATCSRSFTYMYALINHINTCVRDVSGAPLKRYSCENCTFRTNHKWYLKHHSCKRKRSVLTCKRCYITFEDHETLIAHSKAKMRCEPIKQKKKGSKEPVKISPAVKTDNPTGDIKIADTAGPVASGTIRIADPSGLMAGRAITIADPSGLMPGRAIRIADPSGLVSTPAIRIGGPANWGGAMIIGGGFRISDGVIKIVDPTGANTFKIGETKPAGSAQPFDKPKEIEENKKENTSSVTESKEEKEDTKNKSKNESEPEKTEQA
ncbi:uncharacterized protein LOC106667388 [Cimex lectularius]|uniref:C2H2-type domain-containing protein n=1 Tax=Cimex lectularius TaxID=79782 RepID=A0A8I6RSN4_CIMLE|nr:uncharacterized protein LOC106667388 [Cimex lectularius]